MLFASGFGETGQPERVAQQQRLVAIAREAGMRLIGPNCVGFMNYGLGVIGTFGTASYKGAPRAGAIGHLAKGRVIGRQLAAGGVELVDEHLVEADLDLAQPSYRCNCSVCRRTRFWPAVATPDRFRLLSGQAELVEYRFNTRKNVHSFCRCCGVRPFGVGTETPVGVMYGVNIGCLEGLTEQQLAGIPITYIDGANDRFAAPEHIAHL